MAKEAVFGTAVAATNFVPDTSCTLEVDPGLFYPQVMMGQKDLNIFPLYGQFKESGQVAGPLFPTNGLYLLSNAIGLDGQAIGNGNTGTASGAGTTLAAGASAGATTISVTSTTNVSVSDVLQVDVNGSTTTAELVTVTAIAGVGPYTVTVTGAGAGGGLLFAHLNGAAVQKVVAPFTHLLSPTNAGSSANSSSLTVEKNIGGYQSLQFSGLRTNKYQLKCQATNTEVGFTADCTAQGYAILDTPTGITVINESPYIFAEGTVSLFGSQIFQVTSIQLDIENSLKDTFTINGSHQLQYLTQTARKVTGQLDVVWNSLDDANFGYFSKMVGEISGALNTSFVHPANAGSVAINLPEVRLSKLASSIKMNDVVIDTLSFEAEFGLGISSPAVHTIQGVVVNNSPAYF